ncbi:MAG TPA: hypothetical protein DCY03_32615 [Planctomycetaceae bacterium]|nr:hypothetical protein [Planctomycetaceae bacterium]|tara:strand:+ start:11680 stop:12573 length:894 start_codon:yes stop_codon:yes gene_type:complete
MPLKKLDSDHIPVSSEVFLDTSIHLSKFKGTIFKERIETVLRFFNWKSTCTYTKVEFGNNLLAAAQYNITKIEKYNSLERSLDFIFNTLPHKFHGNTVIWTFNLLKDRMGGNDEEATERALLYLRTIMKVGVKFVDELCDSPIMDETCCYWAKRGVIKKDNQYRWESPKCKRSQKRCHLDDFFLKNLKTFKKIKSAIDSLPDTDQKKTKQLKDFSEIIEKAETDPGFLLDYKSGCKRLADAIIAVESMGFKNMFSQNIAESELLTDVLGQVFYYLPASDQNELQVSMTNTESEDEVL